MRAADLSEAQKEQQRQGREKRQIVRVLNRDSQQSSESSADSSDTEMALQAQVDALMARLAALEAAPAPVAAAPAPVAQPPRQPHTATGDRMASLISPFHGATGEYFISWLQRFELVASACSLTDADKCRCLPAYLLDIAAEHFLLIAEATCAA